MEATRFALLGLATGAIYAVLGQGLVLVYRGAGSPQLRARRDGVVWRLRILRLDGSAWLVAARGAHHCRLAVRPRRRACALGGAAYYASAQRVGSGSRDRYAWHPVDTSVCGGC